MLTDGDRQWLETKFSAIHAEIKEQGSKVHKLENRFTMLEAGSPHKCDEAIRVHESQSWAHNQYKAGGILAGIVAVIEGIRGIFHK